VHVEVAKLAKEGYEFVMIGHKGHPEVEGTMGQLSEGIYLVEDVADVADVHPRGDKLAVVTQTTLSVDDAAEILAAVAKTAQRVAKAVIGELKPDGVNLLQANGAGAGQSVPHLHIHIMPRRPKDGVALNWDYKPGDKAEIEAIYRRLKAVL